MGEPAASFEVRADSAASVVLGVQRARAQVTKPAGAFVFCSGRLNDAMPEIAAALGKKHDFPIVVLGGPGVLSERGELEDADAATGLVWSGKRAELCVCETSDELTTADLTRLLEPSAAKPTGLFVRSEGFDPEQLWQLRRTRPYPLVFGAGIHGEPGIVCVERGEVRQPKALSIALDGLSPPTIRTAHSCRLLHEPMRVTRADGAMIQEVDGQPALAVLERLGAELVGQPLVFTVLAHPNADEPSGYELLVRGIQGIDPDAQSLLISQEIQPDMLLTFAVRDPAAARDDIGRTCRQATRAMAGAAPRFGLYFNCSGRGRALHEAPNVDTRILREQFGSTPLAGLQSAFEIGPFDRAPALQLYTAILAVFGSPS